MHNFTDEELITHDKAIRKQERERHADVCDKKAAYARSEQSGRDGFYPLNYLTEREQTATKCAKAIRALGDSDES